MKSTFLTEAGGFFAQTQSLYRGTIAGGSNGFFFYTRFGLSSSMADYANATVFVGLSSANIACAQMTQTGSASFDYCGFTWVSSSANNAAGIGTNLRFATGSNWWFVTAHAGLATYHPTPIKVTGSENYEFYIYAPPFPSTSSVFWRIKAEISGAFLESGSATGTLVALPNPAVAMSPWLAIGQYSSSVAPVSGRVSGSIFFNRMYIESDR